MSILEVIKEGKRRTFHWKDGKSDSCVRVANLDTGEIWSYMGKQIFGKKIKPTSSLYDEIVGFANVCAKEM